MSGTGQGSRAGLLQPFSCILVTLITLPPQDNQILMRRGRLTNTNNFWVHARSLIQEVTGSDTGMGHIFQTRAGSYWNKTDRAALIRHNSAAIYSILFPFQCDILAARIGAAFPLKFCNLVWLERTFQLLNKRNQSGPSLAMTYCQSKTAGMVGWMDFQKHIFEFTPSAAMFAGWFMGYILWIWINTNHSTETETVKLSWRRLKCRTDTCYATKS